MRPVFFKLTLWSDPQEWDVRPAEWGACRGANRPGARTPTNYLLPITQTRYYYINRWFGTVDSTQKVAVRAHSSSSTRGPMRVQWPALHILLVANWILLVAAFSPDLLVRAPMEGEPTDQGPRPAAAPDPAPSPAASSAAPSAAASCAPSPSAAEHPSTPMPEELAKAVALKYHEKDTTLELLKVYPRSIKVATNCLGKDCPCKR